MRRGRGSRNGSTNIIRELPKWLRCAKFFILCGKEDHISNHLDS